MIGTAGSYACPSRRRCVSMMMAAVITSLFFPPSLVRATWSIVIVNTRTREIAVGSATCLADFDLRKELPVVLVDIGAACAQARVDFGAINRMVIHSEMLQGIRPEKIIEKLSMFDSNHDSRQYGIANTLGRTTTFTGVLTFDFADGVTGTSGDLIYAIQGNVITGLPVITMAEHAVINTPGGLPEKLMAAMEAARSMGGDGRCSCESLSPTTCGSPPPKFKKSAHIGFIIVARTGDTDGGCDGDNGCAAGDYYMNFNVAHQNTFDLDPVFQLQELFDAWRADLVSRPDAVQSSASIDHPAFLADATASATLLIALRDFQDAPVDGSALVVTVDHAADSDQTTSISPVVYDGENMFHVDLTGSDRVGKDRFVVTVNDAFRPVKLMPLPELLSLARADQDQDGDVDPGDYSSLKTCMTGPESLRLQECTASDLDDNLRVDLRDFGRLQTQYTDKNCVELQVDQQPVGVFARCGRPFVLSVTVFADPPPVYQWLLNGEPIPGATEYFYFVASVDNEDEGLYKVRITNTCGTIESEEADVPIVNGPCP